MKSFKHSLEINSKCVDIQFDYIHTIGEGRDWVTVPYGPGKIMFHMQLGEKGTWQLVDKYQLVPSEWLHLAPLLADIILKQNSSNH
jgi:hypothetical protein